MLQRKSNFTYLCGLMSNQRGINRFRIEDVAGGPVPFRAALSIPDKQLVSDLGSPTESGPPPMPRYYFNTRIGDELVADPEGEELRNPDRAWEVARAMIREILKAEGAQNGLLSAILEITDDEGEVVLEFPFAEAILDMPDERATKH